MVIQELMSQLERGDMDTDKNSREEILFPASLAASHPCGFLAQHQ